MLPTVTESLMGPVQRLLGSLQPYFDSPVDPRSKDWLLMQTPYPTWALTAAYLFIVAIGPKLMQSREAFNLKKFIMVYNFGLVILSAWMFYEFFVTTILNPNFNEWCESVDRSNDDMAVRLAKVCWWYYFSKLIEFMDTFIFILRKKDNQISFLHVYHHSTMLVLWYVGAKYIPGGMSYLSAMLNSGVHVLMYTYYLMSAMGPRMRKYLWWKRYMTIIQLIQFWLILLHASYVIYSSCGFPAGYAVSLILYTSSHILLFSNFYNKSYKTNQDEHSNSRAVNGYHKSD